MSTRLSYSAEAAEATPTNPISPESNGRKKKKTPVALKISDYQELSHVSVLQIGTLKPSPENNEIYHPVDLDDPDIQDLADSIREKGVLEPLVVTRDGWIISGHRRHAAAQLAGLSEVPCRVLDIRRTDDPDEFVRLLREHNRQRVKSLDERLREEIISADPNEAYQSLIDYRDEQSQVAVPAMTIRGEKKRCKISLAKKPMLNAVQTVLSERRKFWPLSDRQIHYALLNDPPLKHASKPDSVYENDGKSYRNLVNLLTRARLIGTIPWEAIGDETRPVITWNCHRHTGSFVQDELAEFMKGYWRDLMQSQPNHIEIVGEKNTLASIIKPVAMEYCIPLTIGRGYCSLDPRRIMSERFEASGKEKLVILMISDFDPDGEEIAQSFARSMRDDFGVENIHPIKVALTSKQVASYEFPPQMKAKETSPQYDKFLIEHGDDVFEVEALPPETLQQILHDAIDSVIDREAFNGELDAEKRDAAFLQSVRSTVHGTLKEIDLLAGGLDQ